MKVFILVDEKGADLDVAESEAEAMKLGRQHYSDYRASWYEVDMIEAESMRANPTAFIHLEPRTDLIPCGRK